MTLSIRIRASKTSPHPGQLNPRHLLTLLCGRDDLQKIGIPWGKPNGVVAKEVGVGYHSTDKCVVLVNPQDEVRMKHYTAVKVTFRPNPQEGEDRYRTTLSNNQVPWLENIEPVGLCYADLFHVPETDNFSLFWAEYRAPREIRRRAIGKALSQITGNPGDILGAAERALAERGTTLPYLESKVQPSQLAPDLVGQLQDSPVNSVHLNYLDGSMQAFDGLTLAQMVEIQALLVRMGAKS